MTTPMIDQGDAPARQRPPARFGRDLERDRHLAGEGGPELTRLLVERAQALDAGTEDRAAALADGCVAARTAIWSFTSTACRNRS